MILKCIFLWSLPPQIVTRTLLLPFIKMIGFTTPLCLAKADLFLLHCVSRLLPLLRHCNSEAAIGMMLLEHSAASVQGLNLPCLIEWICSICSASKIQLLPFFTDLSFPFTYLCLTGAKLVGWRSVFQSFDAYIHSVVFAQDTFASVFFNIYHFFWLKIFLKIHPLVLLCSEICTTLIFSIGSLLCNGIDYHIY